MAKINDGMGLSGHIIVLSEEAKQELRQKIARTPREQLPRYFDRRSFFEGVLCALYILHNAFGEDTMYDEIAKSCGLEELEIVARRGGNYRDSGLKACKRRLEAAGRQPRAPRLV